ncbi:hypothetical protein ACINLD_10250 [Bacillus sp. z60-11]|uniref:hypothetical protein n=1 Tax=Bacillus sp. z60-11 TaxID=3377704 RepID=UPI00396CDFFA
MIYQLRYSTFLYGKWKSIDGKERSWFNNERICGISEDSSRSRAFVNARNLRDVYSILVSVEKTAVREVSDQAPVHCDKSDGALICFFNAGIVLGKPTLCLRRCSPLWRQHPAARSVPSAQLFASSFIPFILLCKHQKLFQDSEGSSKAAIEDKWGDDLLVQRHLFAASHQQTDIRRSSRCEKRSGINEKQTAETFSIGQEASAFCVESYPKGLWINDLKKGKTY